MIRLMVFASHRVSIRLITSCRPYRSKLPTTLTPTVWDEAEVSTEARDNAIDNLSAIVAAKTINTFAITGFEGDAPTTTVADQMVTDNDVTIDIEVQVHGNERETGVAASELSLLDFENPFEAGGSLCFRWK